MKNTTPIRCTYCNAESAWSAEPADSQELGSAYECPDCDTSTPQWSDSVSHQLDGSSSMQWVAADPFP